MLLDKYVLSSTWRDIRAQLLTLCRHDISHRTEKNNFSNFLKIIIDDLQNCEFEFIFLTTTVLIFTEAHKDSTHLAPASLGDNQPAIGDDTRSSSCSSFG